MDLNCMKCGRELKDEQMFCQRCQADMAKYPVKPTVTVQIPVRPEPPAAKKKARARRTATPEEIIRKLKTKVRWLSVVLVVIFLAFAATVAMMLMLLEERDQAKESDNGISTSQTDST